MQTLTLEIPWRTRGRVAGTSLLVTDTAGPSGPGAAGWAGGLPPGRAGSTPPPPASAAAAARAPCQAAGFQHKH